MHKLIAKRLIKSSQLIPGKISRTILLHIIQNKDIDESLLPMGVTLSQINNLKKLYRDELKNFNGKEIIPKYLPFYSIIKRNLPNFSWNIEKYNINEKKPNVNLQAPRVNNLRISILS